MSVEVCVWCVCVIVRLSHAGLQATIYIGVFIMLLACIGPVAASRRHMKTLKVYADSYPGIMNATPPRRGRRAGVRGVMYGALPPRFSLLACVPSTSPSPLP